MSALLPSDAAMATRAFRDAVRHMAQDIPDPEYYASHLPAAIVELLLSTRHAGFIPSAETAIALQKWRLAEAGSNPRYLTAFGLKVKRALRDG